MFIDYLTILLVNMAAGFVILALYVYRGLDDEDQRKWVPAFAVVGSVALFFGGYLTVTWPLPGSYNSAYGEMSVLLGVLFLGAALAIGLRGDLFPLSIYAFFAGAAAVLLGVRIINLGMTNAPVLSGVGFILSGISGVCAAPTLYLRRNRTVRLLGALVLLVTAAIWMLTAFPAYWFHMESLKDWVPLTSR